MHCCIADELLRDETGNLYIDYVMLLPLVAICISAVYAALYGAPGQQFKNTIATITSGYAHGFEGGLTAPGPNWKEALPAVHSLNERHLHTGQSVQRLVRQAAIQRLLIIGQGAGSAVPVLALPQWLTFR